MAKISRPNRDELFLELHAALAQGALVRVSRHKLDWESRGHSGFLVGVGERFLLLHLIGNTIDLDGYLALRIKDITKFEVDFERKSFYAAALKLKRQKARVPAGVALDSARELLASVETIAPLLVIHREREDPDGCEVGRVREFGKKKYFLHWISPNATWETDDRPYRYADVTSVGFEGRYEKTLALVSGAKVGMVFPVEDSS
jgi:hypothetical protein